MLLAYVNEMLYNWAGIESATFGFRVHEVMVGGGATLRLWIGGNIS